MEYHDGGDSSFSRLAEWPGSPHCGTRSSLGSAFQVKLTPMVVRRLVPTTRGHVPVSTESLLQAALSLRSYSVVNTYLIKNSKTQHENERFGPSSRLPTEGESTSESASCNTPRFNFKFTSVLSVVQVRSAGPWLFRRRCCNVHPTNRPPALDFSSLGYLLSSSPKLP
jgi:hypothetical protein